MKSSRQKLLRVLFNLFIISIVLAGIIGPFSFAAAKNIIEPWSFGVMGDTQWTCPTDPAGDSLSSNILTLWGMPDFGTNESDVYTLSMTYDKKKPAPGNGTFGIAALDSNSKWVNTVDMNSGGTKTFVKGPWKAEYGLGAYGIDTRTRTVWAVLNYNGDFAVARNIEPVPGHRK